MVLEKGSKSNPRSGQLGHLERPEAQRSVRGKSSLGSPLTPRQKEILDYIEDQIRERGHPPTYRDIASAFHYDSVATVQDFVRALIKKGFLHKEPGVARGIRLAHRSEAIDIPILGQVPAGLPRESFAESGMGSLAIAALPGMKRLDSSLLYALKVTGDSMIDAGIFENDWVIVRKQETAQSGDIVVALIDGEATVKYFDLNRGRPRLLPANPRYSPIELQEFRENRIAGKVIALQRSYRLDSAK